MTREKLAERYLGEPAFCVSKEGAITRTAVSELALSVRSKKKGSDIFSVMSHSLDRESYSLLNGGSDPHFFLLDEAVTKAKEILQARIESPNITKAQEQTAREYLAAIKTDAGKQKICEQSLVERSISSLLRDRTLGGEETFPTEYFRPGKQVFGIVAPSTHNSIMPAWRPRPYFILTEVIASVAYAPQWKGKVCYRFTRTHYYFSHDLLFAKERKARERLQEVFQQETGGTISLENIQVFKVAVEKKWHDEYMKKLMKHIT